MSLAPFPGSAADTPESLVPLVSDDLLMCAVQAVAQIAIIKAHRNELKMAFFCSDSSGKILISS